MQTMRVLSRNQVKWIALITMICDHVGLAIFDGNLEVQYILRILIGRCAFPIFATLFVDSFFHIKKESRFHHLMILAVFALISEIPFNMMCSGSIFDPKYQSVMLTWAIAFVLLWLMDELHEMQNMITPVGSIFASIMLMALFAWFAYFVKTDYAHWSMIAVGIAYLVKEYYQDIDIVLTGCMVCFVVWLGSGFITVFLALIPLLLYDGHKLGRKTKYVHYIAYPLHIFLLGLYVCLS